MVVEFEQKAPVSLAESEEIRVGIFTVAWRRAQHLPQKVQELLDLKAEDPYLELHVPEKVEAPTPQAILGSFRNGFRAVAQFLQDNQLKPRLLVGVTHLKLAHAASLYGFRLLPIDVKDVDEDRFGRINRGYELTHNFSQGKTQGETVICYQPFERFMARFNGH